LNRFFTPLLVFSLGISYSFKQGVDFRSPWQPF
jgi:hypothetical protein